MAQPKFSTSQAAKVKASQKKLNGLLRKSMDDPVNPSHYAFGKVECIDAIESALGREGFIAFLRGQVIKYSWRLGKKDAALQDAKKTEWYQTRLIKTLEEKDETV